MSEQHVALAARMYECRATARRLLGDRFEPKMRELANVVRAVAKRDGCNNIVAGATIIKEARLFGMDLLMLMAAVVEMTEPTLAVRVCFERSVCLNSAALPARKRKKMKPIKRTVRVTIEKEIEIELMPSLFGDMTEEEYLADFRKGLWYVESMDDVVKYAARTAAYYGGGGEHDGLGLLAADYSTHPRVPDVKFREISDESEEEIL